MTLIEPLVQQITLPPTPDWRVVGPWYRWERRDGLEPERAQNAPRPALHKFGSTEYVADFLADPQRSLVFDPDVDVYQQIDTVTNPVDSEGRKKFLTNKVRVPTETRKLFLAAHQRFYLVSAGLHCARPGFPRVAAESVTEVGFVVRRHRVIIEDDQLAAAAGMLRDLTVARATAKTQLAFANAGERAKTLHPFRSPKRKRVQSGPVAALKAFEQVEQAKRALFSWAQISALETVTEGWIATGDGSFGSWVPLEDEPQELLERTYPMRLLAPNPIDPDHAPHDGPIYWGPIPTASDEITADGSARFNEVDLYRIQVYARADAGSCPGPLVWSAPSESFRLAGFYDPDGCSQRPTEIRLPDFNQLRATDAKPSVKMTAPPGSSIAALPSGESLDDQTQAEICFWFIPLITIIATFVLNIFLPIVVFIFQLFFMLKLKFCIPPSIDIELELSAELDIEPPQFEFEADFDVHVDAGNTVAIANALKDMFNGSGKEYQDQMYPPTEPPPPFDPDFDFGDEMVSQFSVDALMKLGIAQGYGHAADGGAPTFGTEPNYTSHVEFEEVFHP